MSTFEDHTVSSSNPDHRRDGNVLSSMGENSEMDRSEFSSGEDRSTRDADTDGHQHGDDPGDVPTPKAWQESYTCIVLVCLFIAIGLLVMCIPILPSRINSDYAFISELIVIRNFVLIIVIVSTFAVMVWLSLRVVQLHNKGLVLWPRQCKHCAFALIQIKLLEKALEKRQTFKLDKMKKIQRENGEVPTVSNVTQNIVYIFSGLAFLYIFTELVNVYLCFDKYSMNSPANATNTELISVFVSYSCIFAVVYCLSFHLIPNYCDAFIIAVPRMRWTSLLLIEMGIWICIQRLVAPFTFDFEDSSDKQRAVYLCLRNDSAGEFVTGVLSIFQPFTIELPIMITWLFIEMRSQFLPQQAYDIMKTFHTENGISIIGHDLVRRSNWSSLRRILYNSSAVRRKISNPNESDVRRFRSSQSNGGISYESIEMRSFGAHEDSLGCRCPECVNLSRNSKTSNRVSAGALSNNIEKIVAVTLLICVVYLGLSNLVLAGNYPKLRGRYLQWFLRMTFFTPMIIIIVWHRNLIRGDDGSHVARVEGVISQENNIMLLITVTGAFLFETICFISSVGNLCTVIGLSEDEIAMNIVSVFASLFGVCRKYYQSIFLLCVQRLQPRDDREKKWTLLCLIVVGMTNVTQWMYDSLVHEVGSSVAWPSLSMFFDGKIGAVIGMLCVPFLHLYELHAATIAYEMYKVIWRL
ncbi:uncharacterized protein LOC121409497 [Lytechinus variegatus]|uniref:uncharacterized protein LOC121409497 n=1 Tax=Lytechinus variegatus TaxID=7654 RepID=UPI001BB13100|nr:uncharacterized protein LOC121409497 [Lytechinus variegatus]